MKYLFISLIFVFAGLTIYGLPINEQATIYDSFGGGLISGGMFAFGIWYSKRYLV